MADDPRPTMDEAVESITTAMRGFGVPLQEAVKTMADAFNNFLEYLRKHHPNAFDEEGNLRDDWMWIVYQDNEARGTNP